MADNFDRITVSVTDAFGNMRPVTSTLSNDLAVLVRVVARGWW